MRLHQVALTATLLTSICFAQQVGFRDLTAAAWRVPADHIPRPTQEICPIVNSEVSDGAIVQTDTKQKEHVQIEITEVAPPQLQIGGEFQATVRFENLGKAVVRVPWETDGERVTRMSADGKEESYQVVDISLRLGTGSKREGPVFLKAAGALFAHPDLTSSYLDLPPGTWVDIRIKGRVECGHSGVLCNDVEPDEKGELGALWYEREVTHRVEGCKEDYGNYVIRELESTPKPVVVLGSQVK